MSDAVLPNTNATRAARQGVRLPGYKSPQVCKMTGLTYRQLDYWNRTGRLKPSILDARGSGTQRRYSDDDVELLRRVKANLERGMTVDGAFDAARTEDGDGYVEALREVMVMADLHHEVDPTVLLGQIKARCAEVLLS